MTDREVRPPPDARAPSHDHFTASDDSDDFMSFSKRAEVRRSVTVRKQRASLIEATLLTTRCQCVLARKYYCRTGRVVRSRYEDRHSPAGHDS